MPDPFRVYVGFGAEEMAAVNVAMHSITACASISVDVRRISRLTLGRHYTRPTTLDAGGRLWDEISDAPMSTEHAIARFFVPWLCDYQGWALFVDGDVMFRKDIAGLIANAVDDYAVMCVQHPPLPGTGGKKDNAIQLPYKRKNWSSVMLLNCGHPLNKALTLDVVNSLPGRNLHAFSWLPPAAIGVLPPTWNYLVGVHAPPDDPAVVHYTLGVPILAGHEHDPFADEWFSIARALGYRYTQPQRLMDQAAAG